MFVDTINTLISVIFTVITLWVIYRNIANARLSALFTLASITVLTIIGFVFCAIISNEFLANISVVIALSLITYKKNERLMALNVFYAIFSMLIVLVIGNIMGTIVVIIFSTTVPDIRSDLWLYYVALIPQPIIGLIVSPLIGKFFHAKLNKLAEPMKEKLSLYLMIGASITWALYMVNIFLPAYLNDYAVKDTIYTILIAAYFVFIMIAMYAFIEKMQGEMDLEHNKKMLEQLQLYTSNLETISDEMRKFRHDHVNMLSGLFGYIENGDTEGLSKYLTKYILPFNTNASLANASLDKLRNIKIPELKGILFVKLLHAQELGINVHIEVYEEVKVLNIDLVDLCRIVGIALDNAIESYDSVKSDKNFKLQFGAIKKESSTQLVFENTINDSVPLTRIFEKGFSTKSGARGLGLYTMQQIISKHTNADMMVEAKDCLFSLIIDISNT